MPFYSPRLYMNSWVDAYFFFKRGDTENFSSWHNSSRNQRGTFGLGNFSFWVYFILGILRLQTKKANLDPGDISPWEHFVSKSKRHIWSWEQFILALVHFVLGTFRLQTKKTHLVLGTFGLGSNSSFSEFLKKILIFKNFGKMLILKNSLIFILEIE